MWWRRLLAPEVYNGPIQILLVIFLVILVMCMCRGLRFLRREYKESHCSLIILEYQKPTSVFCRLPSLKILCPVCARAQEMEILRQEFQDSQAEIMEKYEQLQGDHDDLLLRYERRESREEDLARIRVLEAECAECGNKVKKAEEDMKFYKV